MNHQMAKVSGPYQTSTGGLQPESPSMMSLARQALDSLDIAQGNTGATLASLLPPTPPMPGSAPVDGPTCGLMGLLELIVAKASMLSDATGVVRSRIG